MKSSPSKPNVAAHPSRLDLPDNREVSTAFLNLGKAVCGLTALVLLATGKLVFAGLAIFAFMVMFVLEANAEIDAVLDGADRFTDD